MKSFFMIFLLIGLCSATSNGGQPPITQTIEATAKYQEDFILKKIDVSDSKLDAKAKLIEKENKLLSARIDAVGADLDTISTKLEKSRTLRKLKRELRREARLALSASEE